MRRRVLVDGRTKANHRTAHFYDIDINIDDVDHDRPFHYHDRVQPYLRLVDFEGHGG